MNLATIVASLRERGFLPEAPIPSTLLDIQTQLNAVVEEAGEISRHLRRHAQRGDKLDLHLLSLEAADVVIAATCLLWRVVGNSSWEADLVIVEKLQADRHRGWLHSGLSRHDYELAQANDTNDS